MWFLLLTAVFIPVVGAGIIYYVREERHQLRSVIAAAAVLLNFLIVLIIMNRVFAGDTMHISFFNILGASIVLRADFFSVIFAVLCSFLWIPSIVYSIGYMKDHHHNRRFFVFYILNLGITCGLAFSGNLFTLFIFFKFLTLSTFPLVAHSESKEAKDAALLYVNYSVASGAMLFFTVITLQFLNNQGIISDLVFNPGGVLNSVPDQFSLLVTIAFSLGFLSFAVKAALIPVHGWLPRAMVAAAPVSALFHAVAVVNTGIFGIIRLIYYIYGPQWFSSTWFSFLVSFSVITMIYGSLRALRAEELKLRLAYSTISQMGYLTLASVLLNSVALTGALLHFFNHAFLKITLFFCAGIIISLTGKTRIWEMSGIGRKLPKTMTAFSIAALGLIGLPPVNGYVIKLYLIRSGIQMGSGFETFFIISVVLFSGFLNALYYLPIIIHAFWGKNNFDRTEVRENEKRLMLYPTLFLAFTCIILGLFFVFITFPLVEPVANSIG
ncbi:MAG: proton-conducting membrane transporter [Firmicutes bacterium HGW-Firmicutes-13]|nr:MAG: proton-conducting membrane transporter [Firmicutes bacterium HGW-Firmicutes-13]